MFFLDFSCFSGKLVVGKKWTYAFITVLGSSYNTGAFSRVYTFVKHQKCLRLNDSPKSRQTLVQKTSFFSPGTHDPSMSDVSNGSSD